MSLMLPEQGSVTEQEQTVTSSLRASPFPKKPGTVQISPRLGASFAPHGMPCSGISKEKQEKAAKCSRDLDGFCHAKRMAPPWSTQIQQPLLANPALPTPGQPSRSAGGYLPPGNISLISPGIPPLSHEAPSQPNKAPQVVGENQPGRCLFPTKAAKLDLF